MDDDAHVYLVRVKPGPEDRELYFVDRSKTGEKGTFFTYVPDKATKYRTKTLAEMEAPKHGLSSTKCSIVSLEDAKVAYVRRKIIDG